MSLEARPDSTTQQPAITRDTLVTRMYSLGILPPRAMLFARGPSFYARQHGTLGSLDGHMHGGKAKAEESREFSLPTWKHVIESTCLRPQSISV